jgi:hypothetical protein
LLKITDISGTVYPHHQTLTWPIACEDFINFSLCESFRLYMHVQLRYTIKNNSRLVSKWKIESFKMAI